MMTMDLSCPKEYESHVSEWEDGLPSLDDLTPLFQVLISPELASAFSITPDPAKTLMDVTRASEITLSNLCKSSLSSISNVQSFSHKKADELESEQSGGGLDEVRKVRRTENAEEVYSATEKDKDSSNEQQETSGSNTNVNANTKRARLVWTPQLHKRFVDAVAHLGIKKAVPKTIMQLMNVEGLTRENVASHLQKYRLYLKRMQGLSNGGPTPSDELFASTPVPPSFREALGGGNVAVPMTYGATTMPGHSGMVPGVVAFHGYDPNQYKPREHEVVVPFHGFGSNQYNLIREQPRDWSGNKFGSSMLHHVNPHCN